MHLRGPKGQLKVSPQSGAMAGSLPSCAAEQPGKVCFPYSEQTKISSLKVSKCERFDRSDVHDFYTKKSS